MQSRSVGVNRVGSQQSSKSTRSRATKRVFPPSPISTFLRCRTCGPRGLSRRPSPRDSRSKISNSNCRESKSIRGSIVRIRAIHEVMNVCYECATSIWHVRYAESVFHLSLSLIAISIWRHSSPPRVFGNVVSVIRLRPHTGLVIFFKHCLLRSE